MNRIQQVLDTDKQYVRNITVNLNELVNIRMNNQANNTFEEERLQFDKNLQLTTVHYTINKLNNSQLVKIAYFTECCGLKSVQHSLNTSNLSDQPNTSMQPMLFNNAYSIVSSSNNYQINRPTQSTPSFGTRLSTRKTTTIFINPTKQTSTTVTIENNANNASSTGVYSYHTEHSLQPETTTDSTRFSSDYTSDLESTKLTSVDSSESDSRTTDSASSEHANDFNDKTTNKFPETSSFPSSTLATTMSTVEVIHITAEPESNDVLDRQTQNHTKLITESLNNRRNNQHRHPFNNPNIIQSNQTRYIRKPIKKTPQETANLSYTSTSRRKGTTRPYIKEQIVLKNNGKIGLENNTSPNSLSTAKATIASVTSDRHSLNQFKKDNEAEIERRFSIVILFLSIGKL